MKPREELLRDILDDLKWLSQAQGRSTLGRSHTTVEDKWRKTKKKSVKQRRSSMVLANIKEDQELEASLSFSSTLPKGVAINVGGDNRKVGVLLRSASASAASYSGSGPISPPSHLTRQGIAMNQGLSTSPRRGKKRSPTLRRRPKSQPSVDDDSPLFHQKSRLPKLGKAGKKESMEYAADDEEISDLENSFPGNSAELVAPPSSLNLPPEEPSSLVISNKAKTSSPFQTKKKAVSFEQSLAAPRQQTVPVEVHCNSEAVALEEMDNLKPINCGSPEDQNLHVDELDASTTSETFLLPKKGSPGHSPPQRRHKQGYGELDGDDTMRESPERSPLWKKKQNMWGVEGSAVSGNSKGGSPGGSPRRRRNCSPIASRIEPDESETYLLPENGNSKLSPRQRRRPSPGVSKHHAVELGGIEASLLPEGGSPPSRRRRKRSKSPGFPSTRRISLSQPDVQESDRDRLISNPAAAGEGSPYFAWGGHSEEGRKAFSLDRRAALAVKKAGSTATHRGGKRGALDDASESDDG
jgi:hypothetical protein